MHYDQDRLGGVVLWLQIISWQHCVWSCTLHSAITGPFLMYPRNFTPRQLTWSSRHVVVGVSSLHSWSGKRPLISVCLFCPEPSEANPHFTPCYATSGSGIACSVQCTGLGLDVKEIVIHCRVGARYFSLLLNFQTGLGTHLMSYLVDTLALSCE
jgi:hypothetical protein